MWHRVTTTFGRLASGAAWIYGAQIATVLVQFAYSAVTSRVVSPEEFGAYGVALIVGGFATLLSNAGLSQSVGRMLELDRDRLGALGLYAAIVGVVAAVIIAATAGLWAALWGVPEATTAVRWLAISVALAPSLSLGSGLMRRLGNFRSMALVTLTCNLAGMGLGVVVVLIHADASSLIVAAILSQVLILASIGVLTKGEFLHWRLPRHAASDIDFSWKLTIANVLAYFSGNVGKWAISTAVGAAMMGQLNRSETIGSVPFQQIQTVMIQTVYPEFRHDIKDSRRARTVWPDMLGLVAWVVLPLGAAWAALMPILVPLLFGPGWDTATRLAVALALFGSIQALVYVLAAAIEALGRFRWIWSTQVIMIVIQIPAVLAVFHFRSVVPAVIGLFLALLSQHIFHVVLCVRAGYLSIRSLARHYFGATVAALIVAGLVLGERVTVPLALAVPWWWIAAVGMPLLLAALIFALRGSLPPLRIAAQYGLLSRKRR